jgi:hypothetical protein
MRCGLVAALALTAGYALKPALYALASVLYASAAPAAVREIAGWYYLSNGAPYVFALALAVLSPPLCEVAHRAVEARRRKAVRRGPAGKTVRATE